MSVWRFAPAFLLPLLATAAALVLVSLNRSGGREPIVLSGREVSITPGGGESSATTLFLSYQSPLAVRDTWLGREKLASLGFDVTVDPASPSAPQHYARQLPRAAWAALELDGPAWQAFVAGADRAAGPRPFRGPEAWRETASRLVAVDADLDADALAARYPDGRTHLITAARIAVTLFAPSGEAPFLAGSIREIMPRTIHVPRELAARLPLPPFSAPPPITVSVRYGTRFEPWVVGVE